MIRNEDAYYTGYYRNVRELGAVPALVFDTIAGLLRASDGIGEISNSTLCELLGITPAGLRKIIAKLVEADYIEKKSGDGRGNKCIYYVTEKGKQNIPFMAEKGETSFPKRGNKVSQKGKQSYTLNKELNKELKESGGDMREAQSHTLSDTTQKLVGMFSVGDTPTPPKKNETMENDFIEWWQLFTGETEWQSEKENCERVWYTLQQNWRDNLVQMAKQGLRWRQRENDNPYWYLKNYNGESAQRELPFLRQGTARFGKWLDEQEKAGREIAIMRYEGTLAYCLTTDVELMESAGAQFLSVMSRRTKE